MQFSVKTGKPVSQKTACAIVPVFAGSPLPAVTRAFDKAGRRQLAALQRSGEISGEPGSTALIHHVTGIGAKRVLAVGCGRRADFNRKALHKATVAAIRALASTKITDAVTYLTLEAPHDCDAAAGARVSVEAARTAAYRFDELKSKPQSATGPRRIGIGCERDAAAEVRQGIAAGTAIADGADIARDLGNRPANVCTPSHLADAARDIARQHAGLTSKAL
ncbi:MAG TPA: M17 family peptidase N-terminal domain-containing protein, partial [Gammaproteobacteria bacterium]|nr:M17 family peptidase N-terminal domain-containing protein [Gammaproteobacteria bacterium]